MIAAEPAGGELRANALARLAGSSLFCSSEHKKDCWPPWGCESPSRDGGPRPGFTSAAPAWAGAVGGSLHGAALAATMQVRDTRTMRLGAAGPGPHSNFGADLLPRIRAPEPSWLLIFVFHSPTLEARGMLGFALPDAGCRYRLVHCANFFQLVAVFPKDTRRIHKPPRDSVQCARLKFP